ncbi:LOW QUALITY PROTEIN: putative disease resistance protein At3g14460 [Phoenix dactylifera]|uniref:LOW QUALITY PROTEIN: putative disease resistance protein At3g14460 n=1 Tax=Phoenix dactylifera TaxID=42345 RepID=A0A8B8ZC35_PHODC|nr:LOW QUALITY PROTEIN: putative disease resistance protein At3g14460 [Phoenix dactylifera]
MASAVLSSILSKTSQVLGFAQRSAVSPSSSSDPRSSVLKDLKKLEKTLKRIQAVLHDAEEREIRDESVKLWLKELKEVAYDADDVLDEYQYEVLRAQVEGRASRKRKQVEGDDEEEVSISDGMGDRIKEIGERFNEISQDRERLRLREEDGERRVLEAPYPAPTSHMVDESSIYGRERDKHEVIDLLFSEGVENGVSVIPIVGKGGLGKTTIAQLVYNDPKVKQYFHLTGWVCVSDDFDVPRLTKAILESLTQSSCDLTQLSTLQDSLREAVKQRVLLVLDDVWNEQQSRWESLRKPFVGAEIVRIIVTCRNNSVAEIMQTVCRYHPLCLSPEQSWALFRHFAFGGRDTEEQPCLADMGKQIVTKCSGLPLAVKSIGSLLRYTADEDSWMDVIQSDIWEIDENNEILPALRLSYSRMPPHLKPCFVYCSMFPKDYEFDKDELVRLWMAQDYIQTSRGRRRMEDIGNEYFNDLQRRSFFDSYHSKFFKMHDMIHDLAKSIAKNECWAIVDNKLPSLPDEVRHLYVKDVKEFMKSLRLYKFSALRTLLLQHRHRDRIVIPEIVKNLPLLRCLRILQFFWERKDEIPNLFGNLKHLRHLHIRSEYIEKVPDSVCLLYHLQILVLDCPYLAELPDGLGNLTNLRYLHIPKSICLHHLQIGNRVILCLPAGIEKLTNLQSLLGCYKVQDGIGVLKDLANLQTLIISGLRNVVNIEDARDVGLKHKHELEQLFLHWNAGDCKNDEHREGLLHLEAFSEKNKDVPADEKREEAMLEYLQPHANLKKLAIKGYGGSKFPKWVGDPFSFASLQEIVIIDCEKISSLPLYIRDSLGKLNKPISESMLERVYISGCRQLTSMVGLHHLDSLKDLMIYNCPRLRLLSEEGLPSNLQDLHIEECQQLTSLPGMQHLSCLKQLTIENCSQLQLLSKEGLPSNLQDLHIEECQQLTSLPGMQYLASLEKLTIKNCSQLQLLSEEGLPSKLQSLDIEECQQLTSLPEMQNLTSLEELSIQNCPQLQLLSEEGLPSNVRYLYIEECQQLTSLPEMQNLTSFEKLTIRNCPQLRLLLEKGLPSNVRYLRIKECQQLTLLPGMQYLTSLEELTIKNCPQLQLLSEEGLPSKLQSLYIEECQQLTTLPGMQNLTSLEELTIQNCPQLQLLSEKRLPSNVRYLHMRSASS